MPPPHTANVTNRFGTAHLLSAGPVARSTLTGRNALRRMADDFRDLVASKGAVEAEDLRVIGWTQAQINQHGSEARTLGLQQTVRETVHPRQRSAA